MTLNSPTVGFSGRDTAELAGITYRQLDYWDRTDLVRPSLVDARGSGIRRRYSLRDLLSLMAVKHLLDSGLCLAFVREVIEELEHRFGADLVDVSFVVEGSSVIVRWDDEIFDLLHNGQKVLDVLPQTKANEELYERLARLSRRLSKLGPPQSTRTLDWLLPDTEYRWSKLISAAYHEAGHAVMAHVRGRPIKLLTIRPSAVHKSLGGVFPGSSRHDIAINQVVDEGRPAHWGIRRSVKNIALVWLAGAAAQTIRYGHTFPVTGTDRSKAIDALNSLHPKLLEDQTGQSGSDSLYYLREACFRREFRKCLKILSRPEVWKWVEAVAEAALTHETLNATQIDALNPSRDDPQPLPAVQAGTNWPLPEGKDLSGADLSGSNFFGADLAYCNLTGANLRKANLRKADLTGAYLFGADLTGADLSEARLASANLEWSTLEGVSLSNALLAKANLVRANLTETDLRAADLTKADLRLTNFYGANLEAATFSFAVSDGYTIWPNDFDHIQAGVWEVSPWERRLY